MSDLPPPLSPMRNPITQARHRSEVFWQITIPVGVAAVIIVGMAIAAGWLGTAEDHSRWADVSLIWLILPTLTVAFLFFIILAALTFGLVRLIQVIPLYARQVQDFFVLLTIQVRKLDDKIVEPILRLRAIKASGQAFGRSFRSRK